jgi:NADPH:quinone reductase-like Zn-dependent oxidoreductase
VRQTDPVLVRLFTALTRPGHTILGSEFAGEVEAVGPQVRSFTEGDAVFDLSGDGRGTHAEYLCVPESGSVAWKPANLTHDPAAATCDGATLALRALTRARLQQGRRSSSAAPPN